MSSYELRVAAVREWLAGARFEGIVRLHTARDVVEQQGTIHTDYPVALHAAVEFYDRLRELFRRLFSPYHLNAYDSRYFGPLQRLRIIARLRPLWTLR